MLDNISWALVAFALIIFLHELGHFVTAKVLGFEVKEFAIGFGKKLISFRKGNTIYSFRLIPLGGFNDIPDIDNQNGIPITPSLYWRRFIVLAAGSLMNIISAVAALWLMLVLMGVPTSTNVISSVSGYGASVLQPGDTILSSNGIRVDVSKEKWVVLDETSLDLEIIRDGKTIPVHIDKEAGQPLGVMFASDTVPVPIEKSFVATYALCDNIVSMTIDGISRLANQGSSSIATGVAGPIGVAQGMYAAKDSTGWHGFILVAAIVSANIGFMNLLPIPLLDGGRIFIDTLQLVTRNALKEKYIDLAQKAGLAVLAILFLWGTFSDLYRLASF